MTLPQLKKGKWNYLAIAFFLPAIGFLLLQMIVGCVPFGEKSMLYSDMYHQYFPFFKAFREALRSGDSLLYSWNVGMGLDYLGLISYYLASPLNLLTVFMPENWLLPYFTMLGPVRLGLASLFFAIFLKKLFGRNDLSLPLFGSFYGLCAWALGYQWNIMWMDTFALLPLVALGAISLLRDKRFVLYTVTLFLSIFSNYYIGFFTCIFVLLLFICYEICRCKGVGRFFSDLLRIAVFSVLAIGMTAILELPALAALQTTQSSVNEFPTTFRMNIADSQTWLGLLNAMRQVAGNMTGGLMPSFKEGLPNLYCGISTIFLSILFFTAKQVKLRDKLCCGFLLLFFALSFIIRQLDYIWHGFHFTNMIPYRFSFLYSFVMLYMAYRAFLLWRRFRMWQIILASVLTLGIMACPDRLHSKVYLVYNGVFFLLYIAVFLYAKWDRPIPEDADKTEIREICTDRRSRRKTISLLLAAVMCMELVLNLVNFGTKFPLTNITDYPRGTEYTASMIRYMKEREENTLFYRTEVTHAQTLNDGALNSYNGLSAFTSSANVKVTEFMKALGFSAKNTYNRYCFEEGSPVSNLFLGLKYMLERTGDVEENPYFDEIHHYGDVYLLENNAYLPLGFLAESELGDHNFLSTSSAFVFQNALFTAATGIQENVWSFTSGNRLSITGNNVTVLTQSGNGYCSYQVGDGGGTLKYTIPVNSTGFLCLDMNIKSDARFTVSKNGVALYTEDLSLPQTLAVSQVKPGDVIEVTITHKSSEKTSATIKAGILNEEIFRRGYEVLNASTLELTAFSNTNVEGTIDCNRDGLLYTSIPQNGNWIALVDGKEVPMVLVGDAMIGVELTEGTHTVQFVYRNPAFSLGWKISLICLLIFGAIVYVVYYPRYQKRREKPEIKFEH